MAIQASYSINFLLGDNDAESGQAFINNLREKMPNWFIDFAYGNYFWRVCTHSMHLICTNTDITELHDAECAESEGFSLLREYGYFLED